MSAGNRIIQVYRRADRLWEWRVVAPNGRIVSTSGGQGFTERNDAAEAAEREHPDWLFEYELEL